MVKAKAILALYVAQDPIVKPGQPVTVTCRLTGIEREGVALHTTQPGRTEGDWWVIFGGGTRAEAVAQPIAEEN